MIGQCIDASQSTVLQEGKTYYLFEHGPNNFLVSRFNSNKSYFGSFRSNRFEVVEEQEQPNLEQGVIYKAELVECSNYTKPLGVYYGKASKRGTHFKFWKDRQLTQFCGQFPIEWFRDFNILDNIEIDIEDDIEDYEHEEIYEQMTLF